jgi:hypothetical protein
MKYEVLFINKCLIPHISYFIPHNNMNSKPSILNIELCKDHIFEKQSCEHHNECMKMIQMVLDGQATTEEMTKVQENLHKCLPCSNGYQLEKSIREALTLRLEKKCLPSNLIDCIKQKINKF